MAERHLDPRATRLLLLALSALLFLAAFVGTLRGLQRPAEVHLRVPVVVGP